MPDGDGERVLDVARAAERLGFDFVSMSGQVLYDRVARGSQLDPLVLLAAVAGATERVRLITSVLAAPNYNPLILANQAATLDVLSGGRFILGVGVGWNPEELGAVGVPFEQRGLRADECLGAVRTLWSDRPASFEGRFISFRDVSLATAPLTVGGPPIWVGGHTDAALRRAIRFARAWHGVSVEPRSVPHLRARVKRLADAIGGDAAALELTSVYFLIPPGFTHNGFLAGRPLGGQVATAESIAEDLGRCRDVGIALGELILPVAPAELPDAVTWVAEEILPRMDRDSPRP
jgi:probable F420-dependent oxidoreductase